MVGESKDGGREWQGEEATRHVKHCTRRKVNRRKLCMGLWKDFQGLWKHPIWRPLTRFSGHAQAFKASETTSSGSHANEGALSCWEHTGTYPYSSFDLRLKSELKAQIRAQTHAHEPSMQVWARSVGMGRVLLCMILCCQIHYSQ